MKNFWNKVDKSAGDQGCWVWTGHREAAGYGRFFFPGDGARSAHRISAYLAGMIESLSSKGGDWVLHKCDNPPCVNPEHLFVGTPRDNAEDMVKKLRHSHILSDNNIITILAARKQKVRVKTLAEHFGVSFNTLGSLDHLMRRTSLKLNGDPGEPDAGLIADLLTKQNAKRDEMRRRFAEGGVTREELAAEYGVSYYSMCEHLRGVKGMRKKLVPRGSVNRDKTKHLSDAREMWGMGLFNSPLELYEEFKWRLSWAEILTISA